MVDPDILDQEKKEQSSWFGGQKGDKDKDKDKDKKEKDEKILKDDSPYSNRRRHEVPNFYLVHNDLVNIVMSLEKQKDAIFLMPNKMSNKVQVSTFIGVLGEL